MSNQIYLRLSIYKKSFIVSYKDALFDDKVLKKKQFLPFLRSVFSTLKETCQPCNSSMMSKLDEIRLKKIKCVTICLHSIDDPLNIT